MSIKKYLPPYYEKIQEFNKIMETEDIEIKLAFDTVQEVLRAFFIRKSSEETILAWEEQFNVDLSEKSFEEKKRELLSLMLGFAKLSGSGIENIVLTKTTYRSISYVKDSKIVIEFNDIGRPNEQELKEVIDYIEQLKPAHLGIDIILLFRTHGELKKYTHGYLKQYTHKIIKEQRGDL